MVTLTKVINEKKKKSEKFIDSVGYKNIEQVRYKSHLKITNRIKLRSSNNWKRDFLKVECFSIHFMSDGSL
jgi:hypothetical protein